MVRIVPFLIIVLQIYCIYHAYKNNASFYWFLGIIFFPLIGCVAYLYITHAHKINIDNIEEGVKGLVHSDYQIQKMEKAVRSADTLNNKIRLADAYIDNQSYTQAVDLLSAALSGANKDDVGIQKRLIKAHYLSEDFDKAITYGNNIRNNSLFAQSDEKIAYARALQYQGQLKEADTVFQEMDLRFVNYKHRLEYCNFLIETDQPTAAKLKLETLLDEFEQMDKHEQRAKKGAYRAIQKLYGTL